MATKIAITFLLLGTFFLAFLATTLCFDTYERHSGYYDEGLADSRSISE